MKTALPHSTETTEFSDLVAPLHEPIAIIGIGCRFAGIKDVESFWRVLYDGVETVGSYPGGRFDYIDRVYAGKDLNGRRIASCRGGFLSDLDRFDAEFFGISPREAALLDPQQRLLLEVAWEAAEDAGVPASSLAGSRTGVFVGLWTSDYETCIYEMSRDLDFYATTGGGRYPASGRLAYFLDLRGPNLTVDTACSSSLVAIHLACQSLRNGESEMALAGGVNVILRPEITLTYSAAKMLSSDGRSKFGDAAGDGYVRSEGAGMILLKPLSRALADGDPIYATVRGSAVNNDGRSSGLLISPSPDGQEAMLRAALRDAAITPEEIDYIEAHGTGTSVGDPVEIETIGRVMAGRRPERPCVVGSVKTNIGHAESAAGVAGIIKVALSLERCLLPASLHFSEPNPNIDWGKMPVVVQSQTTPWLENRRPDGTTVRLAGVSGFGITGTNAHIVLQNAPLSPILANARECAHLFLLSAHTPEALRSLAESWQGRLSADDAWPACLSDLAFTAAVRRTHHEFRLAVTANDKRELQDQLSRWLGQEPLSTVSSGRRLQAANRRIVFVFPGQGGQWTGMSRKLLGEEPAFREALVACDEAIRRHTGWSVIDRLMGSADENGFAEIDVVQPTLFAVMISLAALWRSWGVEPAAVVGHSMGECAAAAVSGALSLDDAAAVICHRSRLMKQVSGRGLMAVAELPFEEGVRLAGESQGRISVAANNSPTSTVLSGDAEVIENLLLKLESHEVFCRKIKVDVASHCAHMDPFRQPLVDSLREIQPRAGSIPIYSTTTGMVEDGTGLDAEYWSRNLRQPVLFSSAVQSLLREGFDTFLEINAHPVLLQAVEDGIRHSGHEAIAVGSLKRDKAERAELLNALGVLYVSGYPVDLRQLYPNGTCLRLPAFPWQRERHWLEADDSPGRRIEKSGVHSNLGMHLESSLEPGVHFWEANLKPSAPAGDTAARSLEVALQASAEAFGNQSFVLEDLEFSAETGAQSAGQLAIAPAGENRWSLRLSVRGDAGWTTRFRGSLRVGGEPHATSALVGSPERELVPGDPEPFAACFKLAADAAGAAETDATYRVSGVHRLEWHAPTPGAKLIARAVLSGNSSPEAEAHCRLELEDGTLVADMMGVRFEIADQQDCADHIYELHWHPAERPLIQPSAKGLWILLGELDGLAKGIAAFLEAAGDDCLCVADVEGVGQILDTGILCRGVIYVAAETDPRGAVGEAYKTVRLVQVLATAQTATPPRLWLVTAGVWDLPGDAGTVSIAQGPLWGIGRVIGREHPEFSCANVDLSNSPAESELEALASLFRAGGEEDQIAVRGSQSFVARYGRSTPAKASEPLSFLPDATYLITGGLGGIGLKVAQWMVDRGARHLALVGRSAPSDAAREQIEGIERPGVTVRIFNADVSDDAQIKQVIDVIARQMPPLRGVFHLAAAMETTLIANLNRAGIERVMLPKAAGSWALHCNTESMELDFFVLFSSMSTVISQPGLFSYAAANSFIDSLARYRRAKGITALSIQWGIWSGVGLHRGERLEHGSQAYERDGISSFTADKAINQLGRVMRHDAAGILLTAVRWDRFAQSFNSTGVQLAFSGLTVGAASQPGAAGSRPLKEKLLEVAPGRDRRALMESHLRGCLAEILRISASRINSTKPFGSMGIDSLMALEFVRRLASSTHLRLPATTVFNYPTLPLLSDELARRMGISLDASQPDEPHPVGVASFTSVFTATTLTEEQVIEALIGQAKRSQ